VRKQTAALLGSVMTAAQIEVNGGAVMVAVNRSAMNRGGDWVWRSILKLEEDLGQWS
jgi:hypothetical protein